ncbi:hypothetical protein KI387_042943, partial [Taxus chinensis]
MPIMGRRHFSHRTTFSSTNRAIIALISVIILTTLYFLSSSNKNGNDFAAKKSQFIKTRPEHSFVKSLEKFLAQPRSSGGSSEKLSFPDGNLTMAATKRLDDAMWRRESFELTEFRDGPFPLRVYVYDMPSKFTYDLLWLFQTTYRETANLTSNGSPVHRLIEQHSVDYWLWADLIAPEYERQLKSVVRVHRQEEADLFYIPFFTTISFFLLEKAQCKQLYRVWARFQ